MTVNKFAIGVTVHMNLFKTGRYINIFTPNAEKEVKIILKPVSGMRPVSVEYINNGSKPQKFTIVDLKDTNELTPGLAVFGKAGGVSLVLPGVKPPYVIVKINYERDEQK